MKETTKEAYDRVMGETNAEIEQANVEVEKLRDLGFEEFKTQAIGHLK